MPNIVIIHTDTETVIAADSTPISYVTSVATVTDIDDTHISVTVGGVPIITMDINDITSIDGAAPYGNAGDIVGQITNVASGTPTLSQVLTAGASAGAKITNLTDPTSDQDAATKKYVDDNAGSSSYLVYTALLTQSGTDAPVATVRQNTLVDTPDIVRNDAGDYLLISDDFADITKVLYSYGHNLGVDGFFTFNATNGSIGIRTSDDTYALQDGWLVNTPIFIYVYP